MVVKAVVKAVVTVGRTGLGLLKMSGKGGMLGSRGRGWETPTSTPAILETGGLANFGKFSTTGEGNFGTFSTFGGFGKFSAVCEGNCGKFSKLCCCDGGDGGNGGDGGVGGDGGDGILGS